MYETHKSGWVRTPTNIAKAEKLDLDIIIGFLLNRKRDFK